MKSLHLIIALVLVVIVGVYIMSSYKTYKQEKVIEAFNAAMVAGKNTPESVDKFMREYNGTRYK